MTKTVTPPLTLAQSLRTYAAVSPVVVIEVSPPVAREIARALEAQRRADQEADAIRRHNAEIFWDAKQGRLHHWQLILVCFLIASQFVRLVEGLLL